jgi:hypothetical protein
MRAPKSLQRACVVTLQATLVALLAVSAVAQDPLPSAALAGQPTPATAVPVGDVAERAEAAVGELKALRSSDALDLAQIRADLRVLTKEAAARTSRARSVLEESGVIRELRALETDLKAQRVPLVRWDEQLDEVFGVLHAHLERLDQIDAVWKATDEAARSAGAASSTSR